MFIRHLCRVCCASFLLSLILIFFFCAASPARAASQVAHADPISVSAQTAKATFPKSIDFQATATDTIYTIKSAILYVQFGNPAYKGSYPVLVGSPARTITLKYHLNTTGGNSYAAPGGQISYHWLVQDSENNSHIGSTQVLTVSDSRFSWQHLDDGMLQINWYQQSASFGQVVMNKAKDALTHIAATLGGNFKHPTKLWLYQSMADFRSALPSDSEDWTGGLALPNYNVTMFVIDSPDDKELTRVMPHEMTHLVFHQLIEDGVDVPIWFDEGLAVYNEEPGTEPTMEYRFKQAVDKNALLPLSAFSRSYPSDSDKADLAYGQSWKLISYMYKTFGQPKMALLIKAIDQPTRSFNQDLQQVLGVDTDQLESQWHVSLHLPPTIKATPVPTPTPQPISTPPTVTTEDSSESTLLLVGLLLLVVPIVGMGGLFFYIRRTRERERAVQQARQIINMNVRTPQPLYPPYVNQAPPGHQAPGNVPMTPPISWQGTTEEGPGFQEYTNYQRKEIPQE